MQVLWFLAFCGLIAVSQTNTVSEPVVELPFGTIRGVQADGFCVFNNIPYAQPPIGNRRFKSPTPITRPWNGELDATGPIKMCVQFGQLILHSGEEDCLYLHITTPAVTCGEKFPVRIQIHGGGFMFGSGDDADTSLLTKRGMVVVTMGYRLGPLGFLNAGDGTIQANNGLKDQSLAIKWVYDNIGHFCGDRDKIILAGISAGGAAAHAHMMHKRTADYVNGVILHNGVASCPWAFEMHPEKTFQQFAEKINCPMNTETVETCLQSKSIEELQLATAALQPYDGNPFVVFPPSLEPAFVEDAYITEHPDVLMRNGKVANSTYLIAYTEREGTCNAANFLRLNENGTAAINILNERWLELAPILLYFQNSKTPEEQLQYATFLKDEYMGDKEFSEENYRCLEDMYTDILFKSDIQKTADLLRKYSPGKVYMYLYKYPHDFTLGNMFSGRMDLSFGADHVADTLLTIPQKMLKPTKLSAKDKKLSDMLINMLLDWTKTGALRFGETELPAERGQLVINENCYSIENEDGESPFGCHAFE